MERGGRHAVWSTPIVLKRGRNDERLHPTQKPLPLAESLIDLFTEAGETVLDPFGGSGTFAYAAAIAGRRSIVVEQQESHCEVIAKRLAQRPTAFDFGEAS